MNKGLLFYMAIGVGAYFLLTTFLEKIDDSPKSTKHQEKKENIYMGTNSVGDPMLKVSSLSHEKQIEVWNSSPVKTDILNSFPNFKIMRMTSKQAIDGDYLKNKVYSEIEYIEGEYVSGQINREKAIKRLSF